MTLLSMPAKKVGEHGDGLDREYTGESVPRRLKLPSGFKKKFQSGRLYRGLWWYVQHMRVFFGPRFAEDLIFGLEHESSAAAWYSLSPGIRRSKTLTIEWRAPPAINLSLPIGIREYIGEKESTGSR